MIVAGCGGAEVDPSAVAPATTPTDPTGTGVTPGAGEAVVGNASGEGEEDAPGTIVAAPGSQVTTSAITPEAFTEALGIKTIMVIVHQPNSGFDDLVVREALAAASTRKDLVLLQYEAGDHEGYQDLTERLGLFGTPAVAIVNRAGALQNFWVGFVDRSLLSASLGLADRATPARVSPKDAAPEEPEPAPNNFEDVAEDAAAGGAVTPTEPTTGTAPSPTSTVPSATPSS